MWPAEPPNNQESAEPVNNATSRRAQTKHQESSHVGDGHWSQLGARFRSSQWKWKSITGGETEIAGRGHIAPGAAQTLSDRSLNRQRKVFAGPVKFLRSALLGLDVCLVVCNMVTSEPCV
ncbi:unnamed protein product [Caretta caretta]